MSEYLAKLIENNDFEKLREVVDKKDKYNISTKSLNIGLIVASAVGNIEIAKYLIDNGATPRFSNNTAIEYACAIDNIEVVKLLLENGADIGSNYYMLIRMLAHKKCTNILNYLPSLKYEYYEKAVIYILQDSSAQEAIKYVSNTSFDLRNFDKLLGAVSQNRDIKNNEKMVAYLIKNGADTRYLENKKYYVEIFYKSGDYDDYYILRKIFVNCNKYSKIKKDINKNLIVNVITKIKKYFDIKIIIKN